MDLFGIEIGSWAGDWKLCCKYIQQRGDYYWKKKNDYTFRPHAYENFSVGFPNKHNTTDWSVIKIDPYQI